MKTIWIGAALFCASTLPAAAQVVAPNDPRADQVIREQCERQFPEDFSTRAYCIERQQEARRKLIGTSTDVPPLPPQPKTLIEKTPGGEVPLFEQGPFKPARIHNGYNKPLRRDGYDY